MEQPQYLIDTNAVIDYLGGKLPFNGMRFMNEVVDAIPFVSVITKIEMLEFDTAEDHNRLLTNFMNDATILDLTENIVDASLIIRKSNKTKLPDAIIAATASVYGLTIISRNIADFENISGIEYINPHSL